MTLRSKIVTYFVVLHVVLAAATAFVFMQNKLLLFAMELLFIVSVSVSIRLIRAFFVPLDLIRTGAELIGDGDFTSRFVPVGQREMDTLVAVYNRMIDRLREERLNAEEHHQLLERIVQASPSGIVILDFDGRVEQANPAAQKLLTPELLAELATMNAGESRLIGHHGARRLKCWRAEFRDRGFAKGFYLIEELTEELRLSEKTAYEKLIRMMSHEVNNSVGSVRSLLDSSLRYADAVRAEDRDDFRSALTIARSRIESLGAFMSGFAQVVRIPPPELRSCDVAELVREVAMLMRADAAERNIELRTSLEACVADVDRNQLEQVVINVIRNAMEAIGRDGAIDITLHDCLLTVADSGPGLAPEARDALFTPFFTTRREGRGLGLTIVQEILTNHQLPFSLENRAGGGAEFRIGF